MGKVVPASKRQNREKTGVEEICQHHHLSKLALESNPEKQG
jgi:hypothetical protein